MRGTRAKQLHRAGLKLPVKREPLTAGEAAPIRLRIELAKTRPQRAAVPSPIVQAAALAKRERRQKRNRVVENWSVE